MSLQGRSALVTGAAQGIGKAIALALSEAGAQVALLDIDGNRVNQTGREIGARAGRKTWTGVVDVRDREAVDRAIDEVTGSVGKIDILVNNAGIWRKTPILHVEEDLWDQVFAINVKGVLFCVQAVGRDMVRRKCGKIVNIASTAGFGGGVDWGAYCASKAAVISLTQTMAAEWAPYNIQVNAVCPGATDTALTKYIEQMIPGEQFDWMHQPKDVAEETLALVDPFSQTRTGEIVRMK